MSKKKTILIIVFMTIAAIAAAAGFAVFQIKKLLKKVESAQVWVEDFQTGEAAAITSGGMNTHPEFSPDGERIVFVSRTDALAKKGSSLQIYSVKDRSITRVLEEPGILLSPSFVDDGRGVLFVRGRSDGGRDLAIYNLETRALKSLTDDMIEESDPEVSPDGKWIAFSEEDEKTTSLYILPTAGGKKRRLTQGDNFLHKPKGLAWSPDSKEVAYVTFLKVAVQDIQSSEIKEVDITGLNNMGDLVFDPLRPGRIYLKARFSDARLFDFSLFQVDIESGSVEVFRAERPLVQSNYDFSPDGRWLAYTQS